MAQRPTAEIKVPSEDPKKTKEEEEKKAAEKKAGKSKVNGDKKDEDEELVRQADAISVSSTDNLLHSQRRMFSSSLNLKC